MAYIVEGRYVTEEQKTILERMINQAENGFGESLSRDQLSAVKLFYIPIVKEISEIQDDLRVVLNSAQIDHASGQALDLLCALINVSRRDAEHAAGKVTMSRDTAAGKSYTIPKGTIVQTDATNPIEFETTEQVTLADGSTSVDAPIEAINGGIAGNVTSGTVTVYANKPAGVEIVTNNNAISGGKPRETDDELRERAKRHLAQGSAATAPAILSAVSNSSDDIISVTVNQNDTDVKNGNGHNLPPHSVEVVVEAPNSSYDSIGEAIVTNKAAGIEDVGGEAGVEQIVSDIEIEGETYDAHFSSPAVIDIYVDIEVTVEDDYAGDSDVIDRVVEYIGGFLSDGSPQRGELSAGEDVLFGEVEYAIRDVPGVYDVSVLEVDTSDPPSATTDISIGDTDVAKVNGQTDITVTSTNV